MLGWLRQKPTKRVRASSLYRAMVWGCIGMALAVVGLMYCWVRSCVNPNFVELGEEELKVVYTTTDGREVVVTEESMYANLVALIDRIQDMRLQMEWRKMCQQFRLSRDDPKRFLYISFSGKVQYKLADSQFGVVFDQPRQGCVTLCCVASLLAYPERTKNPQKAALEGEVALVHELQHIRDWRAGRMENIHGLANLPSGTLEPNTLAYDVRMNASVEFFAMELRAYELEFKYVKKYRLESWLSIDDDQERVDWYRAWDEGRVSELRSSIYDHYVDWELFPPESWQGSMRDKADLKAWVLGQVEEVL